MYGNEANPEVREHLRNHFIARDKRRRELESALIRQGLTLRPDSRYCEGYIAGKPDQTLKQTVDMMVEMDWYYRHTRYKQISAALRDHWYPQFMDVISSQAKSIALESYYKERGMQE